MRALSILTLSVLVAGAFAGCFAAVDGEPAIAMADPLPTRLSASEWKALLTEPRFDRVLSSVVYLDADDGTQLSLTLHLPDGLSADEKIPTLVQLTPYQAGRSSDPARGTQQVSGYWRDSVLRGAAYVEANARGTDASGGCLDFGGTADRADAVTFVKWIREQAWSNNIVVMDGVSHPGMGSVVAHAAVPDLTAALAHAPVVSYYQDEWYQGAKFENQFNGPLYQEVELAPTGYLDPAAVLAQPATCTGQTTADFSPVDGPFTALWADRDLSRHVEQAAAPILLTHGFVDRNVHTDHSQFYWDALPADFPKYAIFGWWYHGWPDMDGHPAEKFSEVRQRWLDATVLGVDNGLWAEPRVLVEDSMGVWHEGHDWPLEPSERITLRPSADGALAFAADAGEASYPDNPGAVRGRWTDTHVAFRTEPLVEAKLINGAPTVTLVAKSNVDATKWVVYLLDEAPDGSWQRVTHGYADSHSHGAEDQWLAMTPGTPYTWTIKLMPTAVVLEPGHRLTMLVTSQDPSVASDPRQGVCFSDHRGGCHGYSGILPATTVGRALNTVMLGPEGTSVQLDWVDPALTAKAVN